MSHTEGKLDVREGQLCAEDGEPIARLYAAAQADDGRRLAACWNACVGMDTRQLELGSKFGVTLQGQIDKLTDSARELTRALRAVINVVTSRGFEEEITDEKATLKTHGVPE